ncbi:MAG: tetratricopeptide repeat protein [Pseudomonadota bacterium]
MIAKFLSELKRRGVIQALVAYIVAAWVVVQAANELGPLFAVPEWINTLLAVGAAAGIPVATYIAWFFDFRDGHLIRTPDDDGGEVKSLSPMHWVGLCVIVAAAGYGGTVLYGDVRSRLARESEGLQTMDLATSVAVFPFADQSAAADQSFFATGLSEELASVLGRIDGLKVASFTAAKRLSDRDDDPVSAGRLLDVATVLTGSARLTGDQLRISAELLSVEDGSVLWSDTFNRTVNDIYAVESDIARSIANLLQDRYLVRSDIAVKGEVSSTDAYVLYLQGREALRERTAESVKLARSLFQECVGLDPEFARAHVGVAETLWRLADGGENFGSLDRDVAATLARQSIDRALVLDSELPEAYANLGRVEALISDHQSAIERYRKALSFNPSLADAHLWMYLSLRAEDRYKESLDALAQALEVDPTSPAILYNLGFEQSIRRSFGDAESYFNTLVEQHADNPLGYRGLAQASFMQGELAQSLSFWQQAIDLSPETPLYQDEYRGILFNLGLLETYRPLAEEAGEQVNVLILEGNQTAVNEKMDFEIAAYPDDPWVLFEAAWYRLLAGDLEQGSKLLVKADQFFVDDDRFAMPMCSPGIELAFAYQTLGDVETSDRYASECDERLKETRKSIFASANLDFLSARLYALRGEESQVAEQLRAAFDNGWREQWTKDDPLLSSVSANPAIADQVSAVEKSIEDQRKEAIAKLGLKEEPTAQATF